MSDESKRLQDLLSYDILDTEPEDEFDALTELASDICNTPIALVSLVDDKRQWFKSRKGLDAEETSKDIAFCTHAIQQQEIFEVENALDDHRFNTNPLVTDDPNIRFYAGTQLKSPNGQNIGTLCVIDREPRKLTDWQKKALTTLGEQVIGQLELRKKNKELLKVVSDLNQHRDSLVQAEKLASLGRMAGGIAHELNNPLQVLNNYMELVSVRARKVGHKEDFADIVKNSKNTIYRMARIIQTMLGFVKSRRNHSVEELTLLEIVDDTRMLLSEKIANFNGDFNTSWETDNQIKISCSPVEVSQILINLISNAMDASQKNEKPSVELVIRQADENYMAFCVRDNGNGIPKEELSKVREPFFTTKEVGKGTGLGLFISHQVADRMGGELDYERDGDFTQFCLKVPLKPQS